MRLATNVHVLFQIVKKHHCLYATQRSVIANGSDSDIVFEEIIPIFSQATRQPLAAVCDTRGNRNLLASQVLSNNITSQFSGSPVGSRLQGLCGL